MTGAVWHGGDRDATAGSGGRRDLEWHDERDRRICELIECLLGGILTNELRERLKASGIVPDHIAKCFARYCRERLTLRGRESGDG